jgi:hypothetical protein
MPSWLNVRWISGNPGSSTHLIDIGQFELRMRMSKMELNSTTKSQSRPRWRIGYCGADMSDTIQTQVYILCFIDNPTTFGQSWIPFPHQISAQKTFAFATANLIWLQCNCSACNVTRTQGDRKSHSSALIVDLYGNKTRATSMVRRGASRSAIHYNVSS